MTTYFEIILNIFLILTVIVITLLIIKDVFFKGRIIFTPLFICMVFFMTQVAPPFLLAPYFNLYVNFYPSLIFLVALISLYFGFITLNFSKSYSVKSGIEKYKNPSFTVKKLSSDFSITLVSIFLIILGINFYNGIPSTVDALLAIGADNNTDYAKELQRNRLLLTKGAYFGEENRGQGLNTTLQEIGWSIVISYRAASLTLQRSIKNFVVLILSIILSWIFVAGTGTRAPFIMTIIAGLVCLSFINPIKIKNLVFLSILFLLVSFFLTSYSIRMIDWISGDITFIEAFSSIFERLFIGNGANDVLAISAKNQGMLDYPLGHYHIRNFISAIPGLNGGMPLAYHLTEIYGGGRTTFRSGTYISTAYVDFGVFGLIVIFFLIGISLKLLEFFISFANNSLMQISISSVIVLYSSKLITSGFHGLISHYVIISFFIAFLFLINIFNFSLKSNRNA